MSITLVSKLEGPLVTVSYAQKLLLLQAAVLAGIEFPLINPCHACAHAEVNRAQLVQALTNIRLHFFRNPALLANEGAWQSKRTSRLVLLTTIKTILEGLEEGEETLEIQDDRRICSHPKRK